MSILKKSFSFEFTQIPNELITDNRLSNGAFRVMCLLFSKPDNWNVFNKSIMKDLNIKKPQTMADYWKECVVSGWITRTKVTDSNNGTIGAFDYEIHLLPIIGTTAVKGTTENGQLPKSGIHSNKDFLNNTNSNKEKIYKKISLIDEFRKEALNDSEIEKARWFISYRSKIKKSVKTVAPIKQFIKSIGMCVIAGYSADDIIKIVEENEWQTVKLEWIENINRKSNGNAYTRSKSKIDITMDAYRELCAERDAMARKSDYLDSEVI